MCVCARACGCAWVGVLVIEKERWCKSRTKRSLSETSQEFLELEKCQEQFQENRERECWTLETMPGYQFAVNWA